MKRIFGRNTVIAGKRSATRNPMMFVNHLLTISRRWRVKPAMTGVLLLFLLAACTEPFHIDTDDSPPVIVIYSELVDTLKHQEVMVSRSSPYFADEPNVGISGAQVIIQSSGNETYSFVENDTLPGLYYSRDKFSARAGLTYSLTVKVDFDGNGIPDQYEASTTILPPVSIDSLTIEPVELFGHKNHILYIHFNDYSPEEKNYYLFRLIYNDTLKYNEKLSNYMISNDALFNGQSVKGNLGRFDDISEREKDTEEARKNSTYLQQGDVLTAELSMIPEEFFYFINQSQREKSGENPMFGGPASNIVTNISNGGVGYFTGYCTTRTNIVFEPAGKKD
jgi:hypothetical protein